ncbi:hypothetical protein TH53_16605 [Pedobacter lusitanus]|uniref:Contig72, whole genome shotgun sequence n=1 Tax=Pedobacter lusitanus TaxID=1503925 RepID=A0A0D0F3K4_9SPHI|nr:hypothetical protein [Pedobacter lusitanus]KIO76138.1 hypothetical protein TH53_16605 [Pedobacter lusitanus]
MLKNSYIILLLILSWKSAGAQNPVLKIDAAALISKTVTVNASGYYYSAGLFTSPTVIVNSNSSYLSASSGSKTIPVSRFTAAAIRNSTVGRSVILSTSAQDITGSGAGLSNFSNGNFSVQYKTINQASFAWEAGEYSTNLTFDASYYGLWTSVTPNSVKLSVSVPALINVIGAASDINLSVNSLSFFRNTQLSVSQNSSYLHTVPLQIDLKSSSSQFTFSGGQSGLQTPKTNVNLVQTSIQSPEQSNPVFIGNNLQTIYDGNVPAGNITSPVQQFSISPANLRAGFINKGIYTTELNLEATGQSDDFFSVTYNRSFNLKVTVGDLSELGINTSNVDLKFITADDYKNGVAVNVNNNLIVSKTLPFDLTVKSSSANFVSGTSTIPVSILRIGPADGQGGINTVSSITTQDQKLIDTGSAGIDTPVSLKYSIPASQTINLLNRKAGIYTTDIIYTLTTH